MNSPNRILSHFSHGNVSPVGPYDNLSGVSPITITTSYLNYTNLPITVYLRNGFRFTIPPLFSITDNALIVRTQYSIRYGTKDDIVKTLVSVDENSNPELRAIKEAYFLQHKINTHTGAELYIDHKLTKEKILELGGTIYFNDLDTAFSLMDSTKIIHPYSLEGLKNTLLEDKEIVHTFSYSIEMVDNLSTYGFRYINIGNNTYKLAPIKDNTRANGFYISGNKHITSEIEPVIKDISYLPFSKESEASLCLFRTLDEANNQLLDKTTLRKLNIAETENEVIIAKLQATTIKHQQEIAKLEKDKELRLIEIELDKHKLEIEKERDRYRLDVEMERSKYKLEVDMEKDKYRLEVEAIRNKITHDLKIEMENTKNKYDERAYERKDNNEVLKMLPTIAVAIGTMWMMYRSIV